MAASCLTRIVRTMKEKNQDLLRLPLDSSLVFFLAPMAASQGPPLALQDFQTRTRVTQRQPHGTPQAPNKTKLLTADKPASFFAASTVK